MQRLPEEEINDAGAEVVPELLEASAIHGVARCARPAELHRRVAEEAASRAWHFRHPRPQADKGPRQDALRDVVLVAEEAVAPNDGPRGDPHAALVNLHARERVAAGEEDVLTDLHGLREHRLLRHAAALADLRPTAPEVPSLDGGVPEVVRGPRNHANLHGRNERARVEERQVHADRRRRKHLARNHRSEKAPDLVEDGEKRHDHHEHPQVVHEDRRQVIRQHLLLSLWLPSRSIEVLDGLPRKPNAQECHPIP
mmetsp:Transcript_66165/g.171666  ORF Transcript_66165/g.171666 Transcript_66165/m.171666 type:complete len:255 (+) Transcript_66165:1357-2121(+)